MHRELVGVRVGGEAGKDVAVSTVLGWVAVYITGF